MTLSEKSIIGFLVIVMELLAKERRALEKAGLDVDAIVGIVQSLHDSTVAANEAQEAAKRQLRASTATVVATKKQAYLTASGYLDMAIAAVGKGSDAARNLRRYRSQARRQGDALVPVEPVPPQ